MKEGYIKQSDRKKILLLTDDIRVHSGVAQIGRELIYNTSGHYNWVQLAGSVKHPERGKIIDHSGDVNKQQELEDSYVKLYPVDGYGDESILREFTSGTHPNDFPMFLALREKQHGLITPIPGYKDEISDRTCLLSVSFLPIIATFAPAWAYAWTIALPIPLLPPVTKEFFPVNESRSRIGLELKTGSELIIYCGNWIWTFTDLAGIFTAKS